MPAWEEELSVCGYRASDCRAPPLPFPVDNIALQQGVPGVSARLRDKAIYPACIPTLFANTNFNCGRYCLQGEGQTPEAGPGGPHVWLLLSVCPTRGVSKCHGFPLSLSFFKAPSQDWFMLFLLLSLFKIKASQLTTPALGLL